MPDRLRFLWHWVVRHPLVGLSVLLGCLYLGWAMLLPTGVFWTLDEGGKLIYMQSVLQTGHPSAPLIYPGKILDPNQQFVPLYYSIRRGDYIYSWWPVGFQLLTLPFYYWLGWAGLYVLPAMSGALCVFFAGTITRQLSPQPGWLASAAALITGLATPVAFYSTTFWEHVPSVALFLGSFYALLRAWENQRARWTVLAGILGSLSIFMRLDAGPLLLGIGLALLILRLKQSILFGTSLLLASIPWMLVNWRIMGHPLEPRWNQLTTVPLLGGLDKAREKFIPYVLFNAPAVGAFALDDVILFAGTGMLALGMLTLVIRRARWLSLIPFAGVISISAWVLIQTEGYRSVHGFVLIAPQVLFAAWLLVDRQSWRGSPFLIFLVAAICIYGIVYVSRSWIAAGGLQWGPRYLLAFYPLMVIASVVGLARAGRRLGKLSRGGLMAIYMTSIVIGAGYEARGLSSARLTMGFYQQSGRAIRALGDMPIVTQCTWLTMVVPELYWRGNIYNINGIPIKNWTENAKQVGIKTFDQVDMVSCSTMPLDLVQKEYALITDGLTIHEIKLDLDIQSK